MLFLTPKTMHTPREGERLYDRVVGGLIQTSFLFQHQHTKTLTCVPDRSAFFSEFNRQSPGCFWNGRNAEVSSTVC